MSNPTTGTDAAAPNALLENAGLDVIAESERKGRPRDLFMPWFAANISVLGLSWGAWVLSFGLNAVQAIIAGTIGITFSFWSEWFFSDSGDMVFWWRDRMGLCRE